MHKPLAAPQFNRTFIDKLLCPYDGVRVIIATEDAGSDEVPVFPNCVGTILSH